VGSLPLHEQEEVDQEIGLFEETSQVINLASRGELESSYWDGFMYGLVPLPYFTMDSPPGHRNIDDVSFDLEGSSDEDQAFWAGWFAGIITLAGSSLALATLVGAEGSAAAGMILSAEQILLDNPSFARGLGTAAYALPIVAGAVYAADQMTMAPGMEGADSDNFILSSPVNAAVNWLFPGLKDWTFMDQS
jgi:hypothetical protein